MRTICCELRRALFNKWFTIASVGTFIFLWLGIGDDSYWIFKDDEYLFNAARMIQSALTSESVALSLPALAALPCAAAALAEYSCGAMRQKVFLCGRRAYRISKIVSCALAAMLSQLIGTIVFSALLGGIAYSRGATPDALANMSALLPMLGARMLAAAAFACFGSVVALLTGTSASAYVAPLAMCFSLKLLGSRFFIGVPYVNPAEWLIGDAGALWIAIVLCTCMLLLMNVALRREMSKRA